MPRYFFAFAGDGLPDTEGIVLAGQEEARAQAVIAAGETLKDGSGRFWGAPEWRMHVTDEAGATVCTLTIRGE